MQENVWHEEVLVSVFTRSTEFCCVAFTFKGYSEELPECLSLNYLQDTELSIICFTTEYTGHKYYALYLYSSRDSKW